MFTLMRKLAATALAGTLLMGTAALAFQSGGGAGPDQPKDGLLKATRKARSKAQAKGVNAAPAPAQQPSGVDQRGAMMGGMMQMLGGRGVDPESPAALAAERGRVSRVLATIAEVGPRLAAADKDAANQAVLKALDEPLELRFAEPTPLEAVLKYIKSGVKVPNLAHGLPIYVDPAGLQDAEKTLDSPVQIDLEGVPLKTTLRLALKQLGLAYCVKDGLLMISSPDDILNELREYECAHVEPDKRVIPFRNGMPIQPMAQGGGGIQ